MMRRVLFHTGHEESLGGELGAAGLRAEREKEQQVWGCGGARRESTEDGGMAMGGDHREALLGGGFSNICHPKDCGSLKPLDARDSSQWPLCTSHGTWHKSVPRTLAPGHFA